MTAFYRFIKTRINFKLSFLHKSFGGSSFKLLDVGSGNNSASRIKALFSGCEYYGLDRVRDYNNTEADFAAMKEFYELDLSSSDYATIPDNYFEGIWMTHVIEHLHNGDEVVSNLLKKLKPGGYFYIEYPGSKSLKLPSMKGTLNFYDDETHVRLYSVKELSKIFVSGGCTILSAGTRRNWYYIIFLPLRAILSFIKNGYVEGNVFWDIAGFAEYLWVRKNINSIHDLQK